MLPQTAHISASPTLLDRRGAQRRVIRLGFDLTETPGNEPLSILDISTFGMSMRTNAKLSVGEKFRIQLPEAGSIEAEVVRKFENQLGTKFVSPISQAAVSAVQLASPFDSEPEPEQEKRTIYLPYPDAEPVPVSDSLLLTILGATAFVVGLVILSIGFLPISGFGI
jgi:hypothetical protein